VNSLHILITIRNNIRLLRAVLFVFSLLLFSFASDAQEAIVSDSSRVEVRPFNNSSINDYKNDPDFSYDRVTGKGASAWDRFWRWFWYKVNSLFSSKGSGSAINAVLFILAAALLVYFVLKITGMSRVSLFGNKNTSGKLDYQVTEENIHVISFDEMIEKAIAAGDYRLAIRLLYLQILKKLTDRHLIDWRINKTNIAYVNELRDTQWHQEFSRLTYAFEKNWYGDLHIEEGEFAAVKKQFDQFKQHL
jgi:hypothetical protein